MYYFERRTCGSGLLKVGPQGFASMRCTTYGTNQRWPESTTPLPPDDDTNVVRKSLWGRPFRPWVLLTQNTRTNFGRRPNMDFRWLVYKVLLQLGLIGPVLDWTIQTAGK